MSTMMWSYLPDLKLSSALWGSLYASTAKPPSSKPRFKIAVMSLSSSTSRIRAWAFDVKYCRPPFLWHTFYLHCQLEYIILLVKSSLYKPISLFSQKLTLGFEFMMCQYCKHVFKVTAIAFFIDTCGSIVMVTSAALATKQVLSQSSWLCTPSFMNMAAILLAWIIWEIASAGSFLP